MLSFLSALIGLVALALMIPAMLPLLGWANWLFVPLALFGALIGAFSRGKFGRNLCLVVAAIGIFRLWLGGGLL